MYFANGDYYEGEFHSNMKHGRGTYKWADGRAYEGSYQKDRMFDERGKMKMYDGSIIEGIFVNDQRVV